MAKDEEEKSPAQVVWEIVSAIAFGAFLWWLFGGGFEEAKYGKGDGESAAKKIDRMLDPNYNPTSKDINDLSDQLIREWSK